MWSLPLLLAEPVRSSGPAGNHAAGKFTISWQRFYARDPGDPCQAGEAVGAYIA